MNTFIGYTVGLECNHKHNDSIGKMVCVEYTRNPDGTVTLRAVNGRTLAPTAGMKTVSAAEFSHRPTDDKVSEARWALGLVGWSLMSDDAA